MISAQILGGFRGGRRWRRGRGPGMTRGGSAGFASWGRVVGIGFSRKRGGPMMGWGRFWVIRGGWLAEYDVRVSLDCPQAAPVGGRWFVIAADTSYASAPSAGGPYPPGMVPYDVGDLFVPKSLWDGRRRLAWGWVRDLEGGKDRGKPLWGGTLSLARELFADEGGRLCSRAPAEVVGAFGETVLDLADRPALREGSRGWRYGGVGLESVEGGGVKEFRGAWRLSGRGPGAARRGGLVDVDVSAAGGGRGGISPDLAAREGSGGAGAW